MRTWKQHSSYLWVHRYSRLFPNMWVSTLSSNGFVRWKWVESILSHKHQTASSPCFSPQNGSWDSNLSTYFNMNTYLDIILSCVLQQAGKRRIVFSCFDPDVCTMWVHLDVGADAPLMNLPVNQFVATAMRHYTDVLLVNWIHSVSLEVLNYSVIFVLPCFPQGASQAEQIPHPLPHPGHFWDVSRADGHPLPDHSNRHQLCPKREYSGELLLH